MIGNINDEILIKYIVTYNNIDNSYLFNKYIKPNANLLYPFRRINNFFDLEIDEDIAILKYCLAHNLLEQGDLDDLNEFLIANL
jgi:hypothetical protein